MLAEVNCSLSSQVRPSELFEYERKGGWEPLLLECLKEHVVRL